MILHTTVKHKRSASQGRRRPFLPAILVFTAAIAFSLFYEGIFFFAKPHQMPTPDEWYLIVVNRWNAIPGDYRMELAELPDGHRVDSRIYSALEEMFADARANSIYPIVREGYRTDEEQQKLLEDKIQSYRAKGYSRLKAEKLAGESVALPGTSEHQLGLAVDINADLSLCANDAVYRWLSENAYRYGFILRYPQGKQELTGIQYEPWHYRYVGTAAAQEITAQGICLEEYLLDLLCAKSNADTPF